MLLQIKVIQSTPFGSVVIVWSLVDSIPRVVRVFLSRPEMSAECRMSASHPDLHKSSCAELDTIAAEIEGILEGDAITISLNVAAMDLCSPFQQSVLRAEHRIPRGSVSTYQLIASHLGKRRGARAAGTALARNPFPIIVPCHRAVRTDLSLGGYQGGLAMKQALLEQEGIGFDTAERVVCEKFHYQ